MREFVAERVEVRVRIVDQFSRHQRERAREQIPAERRVSRVVGQQCANGIVRRRRRDPFSIAREQRGRRQFRLEFVRLEQIGRGVPDALAVAGVVEMREQEQ